MRISRHRRSPQPAAALLLSLAAAAAAALAVAGAVPAGAGGGPLPPPSTPAAEPEDALVAAQTPAEAGAGGRTASGQVYFEVDRAGPVDHVDPPGPVGHGDPAGPVGHGDPAGPVDGSDLRPVAPPQAYGAGPAPPVYDPKLKAAPRTARAAPAGGNVCRNDEPLPERTAQLYSAAWNLFYDFLKAVNWAMVTAADSFSDSAQPATRQPEKKPASLGGKLFEGLFDIALEHFLPGSYAAKAAGNRYAPAPAPAARVVDVDAPLLRAAGPAQRRRIREQIRGSVARLVPRGYRGRVPAVLAGGPRPPLDDVSFLRSVANDVPAFLAQLLRGDNRCGWALRWQPQLVQLLELADMFLAAALPQAAVQCAHQYWQPVFEPLVAHLRVLGEFETRRAAQRHNLVARPISSGGRPREFVESGPSAEISGQAAQR